MTIAYRADGKSDALIETLAMVHNHGGRYVHDIRPLSVRLKEEGHAHVSMTAPDPYLREYLSKLMAFDLIEAVSPYPVCEFRMTLKGNQVFDGREDWPTPDGYMPPVPDEAKPKSKPVSDVGASGHRFRSSPGRFVDLRQETEDPESYVTVAKIVGGGDK